MSLNAMTDEMLRRARSTARLEQLSEAEFESTGTQGADLAESQPIEESRATVAMETLIRYIPTESITLYVAAMSAAPALKSESQFLNETSLYWFFVLVTPLLYTLLFLGKLRSSGLPLPTVREWPWWGMVAATVGFAVWALAVPTSPYLQGPSGGVVAGFLALFISTLLALFEPIFDRPQ